MRTTIRPAALLLALTLATALAPARADAHLIHFRGRAVEAPASWPVYRLAEHPHMCVRLDRRAVYLGVPSPDQRCPAGDAAGRPRAVVVSPPTADRPGRAQATVSGASFTGLGFDACAAPSSRTMAAWSSSPYRAIGVYIGGANRACSQPNLTAAWVSAQTAAGWHLIPTYVGLQAPSSACGSCAKLSSSQATAQGEAAAADAVAQAGSLGMGAGSPIYFDMEAYSPGGSASAATLAFLEAWAGKLHALGYTAGVYSSSASGIADLGDQVGSGYTLPDDLWIANWNEQQNTLDPAAPGNAWTQHQRIHQYRGGHDESYGGATINIDNDYVDGATVGTAAATIGGEDPLGALDLAAAPGPGQVRVRGWALDPNAPAQALAIRAYVGGRAGTPGALAYELGPIASHGRADVAAEYPSAGSRHGFDISFATVKSGPQPVCAYALNTGPGADSLLGCATATIPVAIALSHIKATATGVHLRIACEWPAGTECPGHLALRARLKVATHRHRRPPRIRVVTRSLASRSFHLSGGQAHGFRVALSASARGLLRERGRLRAQLIAAIPGGRRVAVVRVGG